MFSELELSLQSLSSTQEGKDQSVIENSLKIKDLEKSIRMLKQEKEEALKVSRFFLLL